MRCKITKALSSDLDLSQIDPGEYDCKPTTHFSRQNGNKPAFFLVVDGMPIKISQEKFNIAKEKGFLELLTDQKGGDDMSNLPALNNTNSEMVVALPTSAKQQVEQAAELSKLLRDVVKQAGLAKRFGGQKEHLEFEAWQTIARWFDYTVSTEWTRPIKDGDTIIGWECRVNVLDAQGNVRGSAENMCMRDEKNWSDKPNYALRSMAQTRTAGKALRTLFSHIAVLAGYSATPAEEMSESFQKPEPPKPKAQKTTPEDMLKSKKEELFDKVMVAFGEENKKRKFAVKSADFINWLKEKNNCEFTISLAQEAIDNFEELRGAYDERDLPV